MTTTRAHLAVCGDGALHPRHDGVHDLAARRVGGRDGRGARDAGGHVRGGLRRTEEERIGVQGL